MVWVKGQSGNPTGKARNVRTKGTEALRKVLARAITLNFRTLADDFEKTGRKGQAECYNTVTALCYAGS
jgi:hypothetical protein